MKGNNITKRKENKNVERKKLKEARNIERNKYFWKKGIFKTAVDIETWKQ